ncbi:hypothetical protein C8F04DRAFT_1234066 [Mycena alexandri]|uniref:Uncharacterized protein n=1 Tax=Mycena alexandri TaxID=1745969 RepID=A0AAD6X2W9_9AGAR|nr:hypothetical protein C8F04DRAFT_1234066 [Mycena alexandri]
MYLGDNSAYGEHISLSHLNPRCSFVQFSSANDINCSVYDWTGKRVIVVASGCTGHDTCLALSERNVATVTLVQRSTQSKTRSLFRIFPDLYKNETMNTPDEIANGLVFGALRDSVLTHAVNQSTPPRPWSMGIAVKSTFIEIGAGRSQGEVATKAIDFIQSLKSIKRFVLDGILFEDGFKLQAEIVILAASRPTELLDDPILRNIYGMGERLWRGHY